VLFFSCFRRGKLVPAQAGKFLHWQQALYLEEKITLKKKFVGTLLCLVVLSFSATSAIGADILFIVADPTVSSYPNDALIKNFLEGLGHTVMYFDDGEDKPTMSAAAAAADLVYISESCGSGSIHSKINEIEVPIIAGEPGGWDEMGLTHGGGAGTGVTSPDITIVNPGHLLAAGFSGTVTVLTDITGPDGTAHFGNGIAGSQATVIARATLSDGQTYDVIFVYEKGAALAVPPADGTPQIVADIRICLGFDYRCHFLFNENAYALIEAAVNYGLGILAPPGNAKKPYPADVATDVPRDVTLSWTPGDFANKHDVYFGTVFDDVNDADRTNPLGVLASQDQDANTYDPAGVLDLGQTYYWRIDEVNAPPDFTVYKGAVWRFTVEPFAYPIAGTSTTASSFFSEKTRPENTINGSGLDENDLHSKEETGIWLSSMTGAQPTWIQYEFDRVYKLHQMWVWNFNQVIEPVAGFGFKEVTIEYSTNGIDWAALANVPEFAQAPGQNGYAYNTTVDFGGTLAKYVKLTANSNWGGLMPQYGLSEVRFFHIPVVAREPDPASGTTDVPVGMIGQPIDLTLSFRAGREAAKHDVYFSTDQQAVIDETISAVNVPADRSYASYGLLSIDLGQSYYWKVNEVNEAETPSTWQGELWDFTTQQYFVVDDIEDYNDFEPDRIFDTWIDGWGVPTNGSQVGNAEPTFVETTIVHGGKQSMPFSYDNTAGVAYSEAERTFATPQDWTFRGVKALTLWFRGNPVAFQESPPGTFTMSADGVDIWGTADEFRFAYKQLSGDGSIIATVKSILWVPGSDDWSKGGVMIRDTLDAGAKNAFIAISTGAGDGATFQWRTSTGGSSSSSRTLTGISPPASVKLVRQGNIFTGYVFLNGQWQQEGQSATVAMGNTVYIGLALTSHSVGETTVAKFSDVSTTGAVTGQWQVAEIGVAQPANTAAPLYVSLADSANKTATVKHPDPAATTIGTWTEWNIDLADFTGVNPRSIKKMIIGVGDKVNPQPGTGLVYFDDIRLYPLREP